MRVIFIDDRLDIPLSSFHRLVNKLRVRFPGTFIILFGMTKENDNIKYAQYKVGCAHINISLTRNVPENGVAIQEWLNHNMRTEHICIITDNNDVRPLNEYIVRPSTFMICHNVSKMLKMPYKNKMNDMIMAGNIRKQF